MVGLKIIGLFLIVFAAAWLASVVSAGGGGRSAAGTLESLADLGGDSCNVVGIDLHGCLYTYAPDTSADSSGSASSGCDTIVASEDVVGYLKDAKEKDSVKAIFLDIDSPGGQPQAAVEIAAALKATGKPVIALIRGYGDSAAYWIASGADTLIASKESDVGSIGVTSSYVDNSKQNALDGLTYNSLSTGKFKDTGSTDKPLTEEEKAYIRKSLNTTFEDFIQTVATNRHLSVEKVRALADGSSMLGEEALANGLIDALGVQHDAFDALEKRIKAKPDLCWPQYQNSK